MNTGKVIVVTTRGNGRKMKGISFSLYDEGDDNAQNYCDTINKLKPRNCEWVFAQTLATNFRYPASVLLPWDFGDIIMALSDMSVQKVLREIDTENLAIVLKDASAEVQEKIFRNMPKVSVEKLKEEIKNMRPLDLEDLESADGEIVALIWGLEGRGMIPEVSINHERNIQKNGGLDTAVEAILETIGACLDYEGSDEDLELLIQSELAKLIHIRRRKNEKNISS